MTERSRTAIALALLLIVTWFAYAPGLSGGFLFDDFVNLDKLASPGPVDNWPAFWRYITSGIADPIGRPLSMLTFLIDGNTWPTDPAPFLRTNVLLHLLDGALLFALLSALGRDMGEDKRRADGAALIGAGLWLLHPLFVSTTLYIVQREAMLPATCVLLGLLAYLHGRRRLAIAPRAGLAWMIAGIAGGTVLAMLCKANGILLPLLCWVLEATVLRVAPGVRPPRWFHRTFIVAPTLVVVALVARPLTYLHAPISGRTWTVAERLLTEPRVLLDYLHLLVVPRVLSTGLYNDGFPVANGLSLATSGAIACIVALLALGFAWRTRAPALSAALLFFFAGHVLESASIPLELYFEHRNYLPAMLLAWPLGRAIAGWRAAPALRVCAAVLLLAICAATTWQRAALWGQPDRMVALWAKQNAASPRAQASAAMAEMTAGRPEVAAARLYPLWRADRHELQLALNYTHARCAAGGLSPADVGDVADALMHFEQGGQLAHQWLSRAIDIAREGGCAGLDVAAVARWIDAAWRNPAIQAMPGRRQEIRSLMGQLALARGDRDAALRAFNAALDENPRPEVAGLQASIMANADDFEGALAHLDHFDRLADRHPRPHGWSMQHIHDSILEHQGYWPKELAILRAHLREAIAQREASR